MCKCTVCSYGNKTLSTRCVITQHWGGWLWFTQLNVQTGKLLYVSCKRFASKNFVNFANRAWLQVLDYTLVYICIDVYSMYVKNPNPCCIYIYVYIYAWCHTKPSLTVVCFQKNPTLWSPHGPCHEASWAMPWSLVGHGSLGTSLASHSLCKIYPLWLGEGE